MPFINQTSPHISARETTWTFMGDMLIALLPLAGMAYYYYGLRALLHILFSVLTCWCADHVCTLLSGRRPQISDFSSIVTGALVALLMPAAAPYWVTVVGGLFAILVVKQAFGGLGSNIFNPAAGGLAFLTICFPKYVTAYTAPFARLEIWGTVTAAAVESPTAILSYGGLPTQDWSDCLLGNYAGPMGATNLLVVFTCMLFLAVRKALNFRIPLAYLLTVLLWAWCFPRGMIPRLDSLIFELGGSTVLFYGFFLAGDPVTSPRTNPGKWIYGVCCGVFVMLFRYYGAYQTSAPFALLLANGLSNAFDRLVLTALYGTSKPRFPKRSRIKGYRKPPKTV